MTTDKSAGWPPRSTRARIDVSTWSGSSSLCTDSVSFTGLPPNSISTSETVEVSVWVSPSQYRQEFDMIRLWIEVEEFQAVDVVAGGKEGH